MTKSSGRVLDRAMRQADAPACYGRIASTQTVKQTNEAFAAAKRKQGIK